MRFIIKTLTKKVFLDRIVNLLNDSFADCIFWWEVIMASMTCLCYFMWLVDPQRILIFGVLAPLCSTQYLIVSVISTLVKTGFENIAVAIYDSDWFWLNQHEKKVVLKILMLAQKPVAFSVGVFKEANLERFTYVSVTHE